MKNLLDEFAIMGCSGVTNKQILQSALSIAKEYPYGGDKIKRVADCNVKRAVYQINIGVAQHYGASLYVNKAVHFIECALSVLLTNQNNG